MQQHPDEIGNIAWLDAMDLVEYWLDYPTTNMLVAAYLKVKPREKVNADEQFQQEMAMRAIIGAGGGKPLTEEPWYRKAAIEMALDEARARMLEAQNERSN